VNFQAFDAAYLDRLRAADPETERNFVSYFSELILIKLRSRLRSRQLAEDIRQETFLRVFRVLRSPEGIRSPERLGAFVNSVCNNVLLEFLRSQSRHPQPSDETPALTDDETPGPEERLITEERKASVRQVLDSLPPRDKRVLRALFLEDRDKDEVCAQLGVGRDYLRVLLHRAKNQFRDIYRERGAGRPAAAGGGRRPFRAAEW
jgi:RNA polymerase sigma-70 factor (ECF subfamily)